MSDAALRSTPISLADLTAINDEIAALARAGVPLEKGLRDLGTDLPLRLARISNRVAERMSQGRSLADAVGDNGDFPPVYRAVVEAGIRAGRLPAALEGLASSARRLTEVRQIISASLIYPLIVVLMAFGLFTFFVVQVLPGLVKTFEATRPGAAPLPWVMQHLREFTGSIAYWGPAAPVLILLAACVWWYRSSRSTILDGQSRLLSWIPSVRGLTRSAEGAYLSDLLALLLEHRVPLHEALRLSAAATGNAATIASAGELATAIERGAPTATVSRRFAGFPPLLAWLITSAGAQARLVPLLRNSADNYREQVYRRASWIKLYVPVMLTLAVGATAVFVYALAVFVPLSELWQRLSLPAHGML